MIEDIKNGSDLSMTLYGDLVKNDDGSVNTEASSGQKRRVLAALYDADGKFLAVKTVEVTLSATEGEDVHISFSDVEELGSAATVKLMLVDETDYKPMMKEIVIREQAA